MPGDPNDDDRTPHPSTEPVIDLADEPIEMSTAPDDGSGADEPEPGRKPRSLRRRILLGAVLAVGLAGAGALCVSGNRIIGEKDATLTTPDTVAGLRLDASGAETADYLRTALAASIDLDESVGAVYLDPGFPAKDVLFFGGTTLLWRPEDDLDTLLTSAAEDISGVTSVDAGALNGVMKCGVTTDAEGDIPICGWADHGSVGLAMFPGRTADESAKLMRDIRDQVQQRS